MPGIDLKRCQGLATECTNESAFACMYRPIPIQEKKMLISAINIGMSMYRPISKDDDGRCSLTADQFTLTFSTRSMKKSRTSLVFVNFVAMLTRPLDRFCNEKRDNAEIPSSPLIVKVNDRSHVKPGGVSYFKISFHLRQSFSFSSKSCADQTESREKKEIQ